MLIGMVISILTTRGRGLKGGGSERGGKEKIITR